MSDPGKRNSTVTERNHRNNNNSSERVNSAFFPANNEVITISTNPTVSFSSCTTTETTHSQNQTVNSMIIDSSISSSSIYKKNNNKSSDKQHQEQTYLRKTELLINNKEKGLVISPQNNYNSDLGNNLLGMQNSTSGSSPTAVDTVSVSGSSNNGATNSKHNDANSTTFTTTGLLDNSVPSYWSTAGDDNGASGPQGSGVISGNNACSPNQHSRHNSNSSNHGSGNTNNPNNNNNAFPYAATPSFNNPAHFTQFSPLVVNQHQQHNHRRVPPGQRRKPFPPSVVNAVGSMQNKNMTSNPASGNWNHGGNACASPTWKLQGWQQQQQRNSNGGHPPPPPPNNNRTRPANMANMASMPRSHRNRSPFSVGRTQIGNYDSKNDEAAQSYVGNSTGKAFSVAELNSALNAVRVS